jgi:riboflavin synthase
MFTGIIEGIGKIRKVETLPSSLRIWVEAPFSLSRERKGDSIAVDGCCLTLTQKNGKTFSADLSPETLKRTTLGALQSGMRVNLERPLTLQARLGGHLVQGHVDGVGVIRSARRKGGRGRPSIEMSVQFPKQLQKYLIEKGSVAVDGISLTVNRIKGNLFELCLIPHTQKLTALTGKKPGDRVNLEVDMMAKYIEQLMKNR